MPFEIGNPGGGRPRKTEQQKTFEDQCREWSRAYAFKKLVQCADSDDPKSVLAATKEILNRAFGEPEKVQYIEANVIHSAGDPIKEIEAGLAELIPLPAIEGGGACIEASVDQGK